MSQNAALQTSMRGESVITSNPPKAKNASGWTRFLTMLIVTLAIAGLSNGLAHGAVLHLVIVADTDDPQIGKDVQIDQSRLATCFEYNVPISQLSTHQLTGPDVTVANIVGTIRGLNVQPDDCIVFAYAGHGLFDQTAMNGQPRGHALQVTHPGPQTAPATLAIAESSIAVNVDASRLLYRSQLIDELNRKRARLVVNWTDCCTTFVEITNRPYASIAPAENVVLSPLFQELFFTHGGMIDLCGSAPGEMAWGDQLSGGYATYAFCNFLTENKDTPMSWTEVFYGVRKQLATSFQSKYPRGADRSPFGLPNQTSQTLHRFGWAIPSRLGLSVADDPAGRGVVVTSVDGDANNLVPARRVSTVINGQAVVGMMSVGDIITMINGIPVRTELEFVRELNKSGRMMSFSVLNSDDNFSPLECSVELAF